MCLLSNPTRRTLSAYSFMCRFGIWLMITTVSISSLVGKTKSGHAHFEFGWHWAVRSYFPLFPSDIVWQTTSCMIFIPIATITRPLRVPHGRACPGSLYGQKVWVVHCIYMYMCNVFCSNNYTNNREIRHQLCCYISLWTDGPADWANLRRGQTDT